MIEGVRLIPVEWKVDDRGFLTQVFQSSDGLFPEVRRIYASGNFSKGTIRGFHMHKKEVKYFFVVSGAVRFVLAREHENRKPEIDNLVISSRNPCILVVPAGIYTGWQSLEEGSMILGISDKVLQDSLSDDYRLDPFHFGSDVWETKPR